jgi:AraC-like DNA-binding protein
MDRTIRPLPRSSARVSRQLWVDADRRMNEGVGAFDKRSQRLDDSAFRSETAAIDTGRIRFGAERIDQANLRVHGRLPPGLLYAGVTIGSDLQIHGRRVNRPLLKVFGAGARFDATMRGSMHNVTLLVRHDAIAPTDDPCDPLGAWFDASSACSLSLTPGQHRLAGLLETLAARVHADPESLTDPATAALMEDDLLGALRCAVAAPTDLAGHDLPLGPDSRRRLALAAEEMIHSGDAQDPEGVASLCHRLGTGERSLQLAFREQFGTSVRAFLQTARLHQAHAALLRNGDRMTLTQIATQYGFWHLGRFAGYYRKVYGCSPSVTVKRVWGRAAPGAAR